MKKLILAMVFVFATFSMNANSLDSEYEAWNCNSYANDAANAEVSWVTTLFDGGHALMASYNYWLGVCESHNHNESILLAPIFL